MAGKETMSYAWRKKLIQSSYSSMNNKSSHSHLTVMDTSFLYTEDATYILSCVHIDGKYFGLPLVTLNSVSFNLDLRIISTQKVGMLLL